ncbi:tyrosine-type recombinase/integrase [Aestuariibacter salexigens]|uniref:tyrosine-type recombinase/integrase n=1 Tax=Aestuariibacter salexigens TaxID=226010 RepID=UPI0004246DDD|nr:site-specific integrase [Aestuariibacter salexigens]
MSKQLNDLRIKSLLKQGKPLKQSVGNGLYFRVSSSGTGSWAFMYTIQRKRKEISIGTYPYMSLAEANLKAFELKSLVKSGKDPKIEKQRNESGEFNIVDDLACDWLKDCERRLKHPEIPARVYTKDIKPILGDIPLHDVNARDVRRVIERILGGKIKRPTIANDALGFMKQLFRHGIKLDVINSNPADAFRPSDAGGVEKARDRVLSSAELEQLFTAINKHKIQFGYENRLAVQLLLLTGVRKNELLQMKWSELDLDNAVWTLPASRTKTSAEFRIPLSNSAVVMFTELKRPSSYSEYVFPNRRVSKRYPHVSPDTLNQAISNLLANDDVDIAKFTVHDLRRTFRSLLAELKVPGHIAERCLNHKLKGVEGIYDKYDYFEERRLALEKLDKFIITLLGAD